MTIELLYFDGCPSYEAFLPRLHELLAQAGVNAPVLERRVETDEAAQRERFLGSPTLRIAGVDVEPGARQRADYGLKCRLYSTPDGLRGTPTDEWVLDALTRLTGEGADMFALVLTGPPGAGKSSVLEALSDALVDDDVAHALVETEALTATHPPLGDARWLAHIKATCGLHRSDGQPLLLVATTAESDADLRGVLDAIGADEHVVVRLEAEPATLARRIVEREPEGWSGLNQLIAASARLAPIIAGLDGIDLALSTEDTRPSEVAERIRDAFPDALRRSTAR